LRKKVPILRGDTPTLQKTLAKPFWGYYISPASISWGQQTITRSGVSTIGEIRFSQDHFWVRLDDETQVTIGLTDYFQEKLGEIYSLRLPEEGEEFIKDEPFSMIEAKNGRRELKAPISGEVLEVNYEAAEVPEIINEDPLTEGWLVKVEMASGLEFDDLYTEEEYEDHLSQSEDLEED
jgi:glycine cleavage system H protein